MATRLKGQQKYMLGASVEPELVKQIDALRGEVPRSRVVERALNHYLEEQERKNLQDTSSVASLEHVAPADSSTFIEDNNSSKLELRETWGEEEK